MKKLDSKVKKPASVFAYIFGSISAIIMGSGISFVMTDISETNVIFLFEADAEMSSAF